MTTKNKMILNISSSVILQIATFVSGILIPRMVLVYFGSEVNGLVSSLNQFLSLISLLEGGVGSVILAALYKPLADKDLVQLSKVVRASKHFFAQICIIFIIYCIVICLCYPHINNSGFVSSYIFILGIVLGVNLIIQYYLSINNKLLLEADGNGYIIFISQTVVTILDTIFTLLLIGLFPDVIYVKILRAVIFSLIPIVLFFAVKKRYRIQRKIAYDSNLIKNRWDGFVNNIAFFIHSNTDVVLLTIFCQLKDVSVYSVYAMVVLGIRTLVLTVKNGFMPVIGKQLSSVNDRELNSSFSLYEFVQLNVSTVFFGCTCVLITPFIMLYTKGITDANYYHPLFGVVLALSEYFCCVRDPYSSVDYAGGYFKETKAGSIVEVIINVSVSIILVNSIGLTGVAIGTLAAMVFRTIYHVYYNSRNLINRPVKFFVKRIVIAFACFALYFLVGFPVAKHIISYSDWILYAIAIFILFSLINVLINLIFDREDLRRSVRIILRKKDNEHTI